MNAQPEALRLIDHLNTEWREDWDGLAIRHELRRLHEINQQRQPLTTDAVEAILARWNYETHGDRARYIVRETEAAHGIKEKP